MPEWVTRITTSPGARSSRPISSKRAAIFPPSECMRNALKRFMASPFSFAQRTDAPEPGHEALGVEREITLEGMFQLAVREKAAVTAREAAPQREHVGTDCRCRVRIRRMRTRAGRKLTDLLFERGGEARDAGHAAEMHEIDRLGREAQHAVDRGDVLLRIELRRHGGGRDECAIRSVESAIGDAEGVAAEQAGVRTVDDHVVMLRMTWGVDELERTPPEHDALAVSDCVYALGRDGQQLPIHATEALLTVHRLRAGDELCGVDHVRCTARMQQYAGTGQFAYQPAGTTGMIEVHVGEQQVIDRCARDAELLERSEQVGDGRVRSHIDERRPPAIDNEVRGGVPRVEVL